MKKKLKIAKAKLIILEDSTFRFIWDIFVTILLLFICTVMPVHMAFDNTSTNWCITYYMIDLGFVADIIIIFNTSIPAT